jgi:hypothetical protein
MGQIDNPVQLTESDSRWKCTAYAPIVGRLWRESPEQYVNHMDGKSRNRPDDVRRSEFEQPSL